MQTARDLFTQATQDYVVAMQNSPAVNMADMNARFSGAVNLRRLEATSFVIVGVGGIGSWVVKALVGMGATDITVIDDDVVEIHNVGAQNYDLVDIGKPKVIATQEAMMRFRGVYVNAIRARIDHPQEIATHFGGVPDVLITAVDNMEFRNRLGRFR
jgi:tRNA A37 threonylcarbamoyladenosine dehydratase